MVAKMQTLSGAVYVIDMEDLTWNRVGSIPILGLEDRNAGRLEQKPTLRIGGRAILTDTVVGNIHTTNIVRLEDISA